MQTKQSQKLYQKALNYFPGGVNSPVRAFRSVGGTPLFIEKGDGCLIWDADGNEYIDFCCSWGPLILGHNHEAIRNAITETIQNGLSFGAPTRLENELAELIISNNRFVEKIRFVSSGTEAVMSAIRLARGYTKKDKIIKFEGCYHGHSDSLLVKAGSGLATFGTSSSAGVPEAFAKETIVVPLNHREAIEHVFKHHHSEIAAVIIEPIPANNGLLLQDESFLLFLRELCTDYNALLIFDEVISGFRIGFEGASDYYNVQPDIVTYGKIIGGGMPVGAYGGSVDIMKSISPDGAVYQAGTLSGNPVSMSAGIAQLKECLKPGFYAELNRKTKLFLDQIKLNLDQMDSNSQLTTHNLKLFSVGSIFWFAFTERESIKRADEIDADSMKIFNKLYHKLLKHGVYLGPSGYEVGFISFAHTDEALIKAAAIFADCLMEVVKENEIVDY
jgi:glutamate-1-semialdehyde 2,1-aminomutase